MCVVMYGDCVLLYGEQEFVYSGIETVCIAVWKNRSVPTV